jgi:hypothetical protein
MSIFLCLPGLIIEGDGEKRSASWNRVKGTLITLNDNIYLNPAIKSRILDKAEDIFLFETGESYSYNYTGNSLNLLIGKKTVTVEKDMVFNIPCRYPESKNMVELPFRFFPVQQASDRAYYRYQSVSALVFAIGKYEIVFFDWNHNGYFDDFNEDRYLLLSANTFSKKKIVPEDWGKSLQVFYGFIKLPNEEVYLAGIKLAWDLFLWQVSSNLKEDYLSHMGYLNYIRKLQGLEFVGLDETLISACEKHCSYCGKNGVVHGEDSNKPGYTPEGAAIGKESVVGNARDALSGLKRMFTSLYHRNVYFRANLKKVSLGCRDGVYVCCYRPFSSNVVTKTTLFPFPGQTDAPNYANTETPKSFPDDINGSVGTLIAVKFPNGPKFALHSATIRQTQTNEEVPFSYTDCYKVPSEATTLFPTNDQCICLFPRKELDNGVIYEVIINYVDSPKGASKDKPYQTLKWQFKTG